VHLDAESIKERCLGCPGPVGCLRVRGVGDLHVIGFVLGHQLVAADAVQHRVHDRPLGSSQREPALRFRFGKLRDVSPA